VGARRGARLCDAVAVQDPATSPAAIELAAIDRGAGDAVMLVHGGAIHSGPAWARSIGPLVEAGYRVIAVDRRGHGRSPEGDAAFVPVSLQAEDLDATLSLRDVETAHVAGVSYGALVALELAMRHPERVLSVTLIEPTIFSWLKGDPDYEPWLRRFTQLEALGATGAPHEEWLRDWLSLMDPAMAAAMSPGAPSWPLVERALARRGTDELVSAYRPDDDLLAALVLPTMIVNGADSEPPLREVGDLLAERLPGARHVEIPGAGHQLHVQKPELFNQVLLGFLAESSNLG